MYRNMNTSEKKKVLAVASIGGHWIQLLRIAKPLEEHYDIVYVSTHPKCAAMVKGHRFHRIMDFSRWDAWKILPTGLNAMWLVLRERPKAIISTGAAPGLIMLIAGKICGIKTIWIDSIANTEHPSACGRIAAKFTRNCYTQWPYESDENFKYAGNIFGQG